MKVLNILAISSIAALSSAAIASVDLYPENTTYRGYAKRDRLLIGNLSNISPAQIRECGIAR